MQKLFANLYKDMPLKHFHDMISNKIISLISPYLWHDPFEFLFYQPIIKMGENDNTFYQTNDN